MIKKKLIGVLIDTLDGNYQQMVADYLYNRTVATDLKLISFVGSSLGGSDEDLMDSTIFNLAHQQMLDGLILVPGTMIGFKRFERMLSVMERFSGKPIVSISLPMNTQMTVLIDNKTAMAQIVSHMAEYVELGDLCYISGPAYNEEAILRQEAYLEALQAAGIAPSLSTIYEGDFREHSGREAVDYFIEHLSQAPKAIVCANDEMAMGAYNRLSELGYHVPVDTKLSGFDNTAWSKDVFPPLTSYDQRMDLICNKAVEAMADLLKGQEGKGDIRIQGELVIRESSGPGLQVSLGCLKDNKTSSEAIAMAPTHEQYHLDCADLYERISLLFAYLPEGDVKRILTYAEKMTDGLLKDFMNTEGESLFVLALNDLINYALSRQWTARVLVQLRDLVSEFLEGFSERQPDVPGRLEYLLHNVQVVIDMASRRQENKHQHHFRQMYYDSRQMMDGLMKAESVEMLSETLKNGLDIYGIEDCFIVLFKHPIEAEEEDFAYPVLSELVFGYAGREEIRRKSFATRTLLPSELIYSKAGGDLVFMTLGDDKTRFGYIAASAGVLDFMAYEGLRIQISQTLGRLQNDRRRAETETALNSVLNELEKTNERLMYQSIHDVLTGLYNRRGFYQEAEEYFRYAKDRGWPFYVVFADIDGLKSINDSHGHDEGDFAIKKIAHELRCGLGPETVLARMSGDEFTAIVKGLEADEDVEALIQGIQAELETFNSTEEKPYQVSISYGYVSSEKSNGSTLDELLQTADRELYRMKYRKKSRSDSK